MPSRRFLLQTSAASLALAISGCTRPRHIPVLGLPPVTIDIHAHIFNGRDIPATGFLTQVFLREADAPVDQDAKVGLVNLIKSIMLANTPTAKQELDTLANSRDLSFEQLLAQDQKRVAEGIKQFQEDGDPKSTQKARRISQKIIQSNQKMQDELQALFARPGAKAAKLSSAPKSPDEIASRIYEKDAPLFAKATRKSAQDPKTSSLLQTLRWAGILTRSRKDILFELKRLYNNGTDLMIFSPSIVDFKYWLQADENIVSSNQDQVNVMSRLARQETDVVLLNFVGFCPLRAALDRRDGVKNNAHKIVRNAIKNKGFAGVKIYPPMGFQPIGNKHEAGLFGQKSGFKVSGARIDAELLKLYRWCVKEGVPIKSHGNNSIAAQRCSGKKASPMFWEDVYKHSEFQSLHVNVAHFGGFEETEIGGTSGQLAQNKTCKVPRLNWEELSAQLANKNPNFYTDVGFWDNVLRGGYNAQAVAETKKLLSKFENLNNQILYGSDWLMIGRLKGHEYYLKDVKNAFKNRLDLAPKKVMSENAMRYLKIDHNSKQLNRLLDFFGEGHPFNTHFDKYKMLDKSTPLIGDI